MCGVRIVYRIRNETAMDRCAMLKLINCKIEESILRWFEHVERMIDR